MLIYHIGALGDTLMAAPSFWALRSLWPHAHFTLLTKRQRFENVIPGHSLFEGTGMFGDVLFYPGSPDGSHTPAERLGQLALLVQLRRRAFDALIYLAPSARSPRQVTRDERFFRLGGIRRRIGFARFPLPPSRRQLPLPRVPSEAQLLLDRLRAAGLPMPELSNARFDLALTSADCAASRKWIDAQEPDDGGRQWLAIGPGSKMPAKRWPLDRFAQVAERLIDEFDVWPVTFGGAEDREDCNALLRSVGRGYNAAGAMAPRVAAATLRRCALYVGNDTGTMHLAASEGVPCVAVFSARDFPGKWEPVGAAHRILRRRPICEGCMLERCQVEQMRCLNDIDVEAVIEASRALLRVGIGRTCAIPTACSSDVARPEGVWQKAVVSILSTC
ncbi:MAG TPA: glycosyltransferase family 9 protein [Candidatus Binatia bacterium]|nr:glycosyltransferase family 9 protein [Candidatus Binatia bacterium]